MKKINLISIALLAGISFFACTDLTKPAPTMTKEEAAAVMAQASSESQSVADDARALVNTEITEPGPNGGSSTITMEYDDGVLGLMDMTVVYNDYVVKYEGKNYTLSGTMTIAVTTNSMNLNQTTGIMTMDLGMTMVGTMTIEKDGVAFVQTANLVYDMQMESNLATSTTTGTVTITGTMNGEAINEVQNI